jgi:uncharacterized membrane protein (DUF106 family)
MTDPLVERLLHVLDPALSWLLRLPTDAAILIVAAATSLVLTVLRLATVDQDFLERVAHDKQRLRQLRREARRRGDRAAARRASENLSRVTLYSMGRAMRGEGLTLAAAIIPVALLATWCFYRLEFHPPQAGQPLTVVVQTPVSMVGRLVHLVPVDGIAVDGGWVRRVEPAGDERAPHGAAGWQVRAEASAEPYLLAIRLPDRTLEHALLVGQPKYGPVRIEHGDDLATEIALREVRLFDLILGWPPVVPAWLVAYLLIAVPLVFVLKRLLRIR